MKPSKKLICSFVFLSLTSLHLHGATDITISSAPNSFITPTSPFRDIADDGGTSNLNIATLVPALSPGNVIVTTATSTGTAPAGGRITVLIPVTWSTANSLTLQADSSIVVGATITANAGGSLFLNATGGGVALNSDVLLSGGTSNFTVNAGGTIIDGVSTTITVGGLATFNAGANNVTIGNTPTNTANFGSLNVTGGVVTIVENSATVLAGVSAGSLNLTSSGSITDTSTASIAVAGQATLNGTSITLGGAAKTTTFGALNFNSAGAVDLQVDANMDITGANTASTVLLNSSGTSTFASGATLTATSLNNASGTLVLSGNNLSNPMNVTNSGTLSLSGADTINTYIQNGSGILAGSAALTATNGATLNGGSVSGNLLGNTTSTGTVAISGSVGGGSLGVTSGTLTFSGTSTSTPVSIASGAALIDTGNLSNTAAVTNAGAFTVNSNDTIGTYVQNGSGILAGTASLTASSGATLNGGSVTGNLLGNTETKNAVVISGSVGGGSLTVTSGTLTFSGTSTSTPVSIASGAALIDTGNLSNTTAVTNAGTFTVNSNDTIGTYVQNGSGILAGTASLTASSGATLNGGSVTGNLLGNTETKNAVAISGSVGGGSLTVTSGTLTFSGTSTSTPVSIASGAALIDTGNLSDTAALTNAGTFTVNANDTIGTYVQNGLGLLAGSASLTAASGATLNGGSVTGNLLGNTTSAGTVAISGSVGGGSLGVTAGTLTFSGTSTSTPVTISSGAVLIDTGDLSNSAAVTNAGTLTVNANDTVNTYVQNGTGILDGSAFFTATNGATLNGGTVSGNLLGATTSTGTVLVSGTVGGGFFQVTGGVLTLTGTINANSSTDSGATLKGTGVLNGNHTNNGTLAVGTMGADLEITGALTTVGTVDLNLASNGNFEKIIANSVNQNGLLKVTNTGAGLANGQLAQIIDANSYSNQFNVLQATNFTNGVLYNDFTGTLIGLAGGDNISDGYINLNNNQTNIYLSLFEDSVQPGVQNVTITPSGSGSIVNFLSGASTGPAQLVQALNEATYTTPGTININTMNRLSPEVHRGMADYTQEALRAHVRQAVDSAPVSRKGRTQVFGTVHSNSAGVDDGVTNAGYDTQLTGATAGMRYDMTQQFRIGALLGVDTGSIKGPLIDTDAQGFVLGAFGRYLVNDKNQTVITGSIAYGSYSYDASRDSFGGLATADGISSDAIELSLGVSTVVYEKDKLRLSPSAAFRYITGSVDAFDEEGSGVGLNVDSQDINSLLFDMGVDVSYQIEEKLQFVGRLGYIHALSQSDETLSATFAASGTSGLPFTVDAPGIDRQAFTLGLGLYYDINENTRVGATYRGEYRFDSQASQTFGVGISYGF